MSDHQNDDDARWLPDGVELDAWATSEPPAGFADRVMAARVADEPSEPEGATTSVTPLRPGVPWASVVGASVASAAATALLIGGVFALDTPPEPARRPEEAPPSPVTSGALLGDVVALGEAGVAVGGRTAQVTWRVEQRGAPLIVEQPRGEVVYVMNAPTSMVVMTPYARVDVERGAVLRVNAAVETMTVVTLMDGDGGLLTNADGSTPLFVCSKAVAKKNRAPTSTHPELLEHDASLELE